MAIDNSIVFKGGTSLSKCFKVINRFSEDLDLSYYNGNNNPTESMRKRLNKSIVDISSKLGVIVSYTKFGEFMRILRVKNHEVMGDIAKLLGVSTPFLSAVENGKKTFQQKS
jgi:predicted nucleotidyltransferase component of viral defense system